MATGQRTQEYQLTAPPTDGITQVEFSHDDSSLLVSSWDSSVRLYDVVRNTLKAQYDHQGGVLDCCFIDDGSCASGGLDLELKLHSFGTATDRVLGQHEKPIKCVEYASASGVIISGSWDETVKLWDTRAASPMIGSYKQPGRVFTMAASKNRLIVGTSDRFVWIWDLRKLVEPETRRESSLKYQTRCIRPFIDGEGYALASTEGRVAVEYFDPSPQVQAQKYAFKCHRGKTVDGVEEVYPVNTIAFHPVYGTFATGGCDNVVNTWDGKNKKRLCQFRKYPLSIAALAFNRGGSQMAIASSYTFYEGDKGATPEQIFIRDISDIEVVPKARTRQ